MAYIKLGPKGDYFGSARLGLYLSPGNAQYVEDSVLNNLLYNFLVTGFFVVIEEHEFKNIKIDSQAIRGIPLQFVGVNQPTIVEPVRNILSTPPESMNKGDRYIIWNNPTGEWEGKKNHIAEFNGVSWDYTIPKNNWVVPVYHLGISTRFTGAYPSGYWKLTPDTLRELDGFSEAATSEYATTTFVNNRIAEEAEIRERQDQYLIELIQNIETEGIIPVASQVLMSDAGNYFIGNNVELALQEAGTKLNTLSQDVGQLSALYTSLSLTVQQLVNNGGSGGGPVNVQAIIFLDANSLSYAHLKERIPIWALYKFDASGGNTLTPTTILTGVIAQPYRVTYNDIRFTFPRKYNLVLIIM